MADLAHLVLEFIRQYGFVALFVYMVLETAFVLHFAPSELVVPFAAAVLVHGPVTFVAFVLDATLGATVGAVVLYVIFARYGIDAVEHYGRYFHVSESDLHRSQRWFRRWGETATFWGRLLPLIRAVISIPAGLAEMDIRKFTTYSAAGALVFNTTLTYLVSAGRNADSPLRVFLDAVIPAAWVGYVGAHRWRIGLRVVFVVALVVVVWRNRRLIRDSPNRAKTVAVRTAFWVGITGGLVLVGTGISIPRRAFPLVTWLWDDPRELVEFGVSQRLALVLTGVSLVVLAVGLSALGRRIRLEKRERGVALVWK